MHGKGISSDDLVVALEAVYGETDFFFFDEIQNYPHWESFINKLHRRGRNLILTGSNSHLLSRELGSALTERHLPFELLPFSFDEFITASQGKKKPAELFQDYLVWGGFPEVVLGSTEPSAYLRTLFDSIVLRDIVTRHRIRLAQADRKIYAFDNGFISAESQPATSNASRLLENAVFKALKKRIKNARTPNKTSISKSSPPLLLLICFSTSMEVFSSVPFGLFITEKHF